MTRPTLDSRGVYQYRRKVPTSLRGILKRSEWKRSLGTRDPEDAKRRAVAVAQECDQEFALARAVLEGSVTLNASDAQQLAARWFREELDALEASGDYAHYLVVRHSDERDPRTGEELGTVFDTVQTVLPGETLAERTRAVAGYVHAMLSAHHLPAVPAGSPLEALLAEAFWTHLCDLSSICQTKLNARGRYVPPPVVAPEAPLSFEKQSMKQAALALSVVFTKWAEDKQQTDGDNRSTNKTISEFGVPVHRFIELYGDLPVTDINRSLCHEFRAALGKLPTKGEGVRSLPAPAAIARAEAEGLPVASLATVKKQLRALSAVLNFAVQRLGVLSEEPVSASGMLRSLSKAARRADTKGDEAKHYSRGELKTIFSSPLFTGGWRPQLSDFGEALYWLPLLMAYTGARREELAQLLVADVCKDDALDVWYLSICPGDDKSIKTASSRRKVPLHPDLIALGFITYRTALPVEGRLFPKLEPHPANGYGHAVGKAWTKYLREHVGLNSQASPSHGFRHTFKTLAREVGIPTDVSDWLTGHAAQSVGAKYGSNPLSRMVEELEKLPSIAREAGLLR
ncbi:site-specific integrase [Stutzerimonas sp. R40042]|uniref:site-specific integrase n=1 Tax=Stutzerimonas TaxID=2901164 RepID=UPI002278CF95|nr:site-specific integrase [Stutzerimonas sp. R40042]WAE63602.1 site-specific integrase [Stutzerimonas sp. R40042]